MAEDGAERRVRVICDPGSNWKWRPDEPAKAAKSRWLDLIGLCAAAGADAFKPQLLRRTAYPEGSPEARLVADYEWPERWLPWLARETKRAGLAFGLTVYEPAHVARVAPYLDFLKIASFELGHAVLLREAVSAGLPLVVSTGMAGWAEVRHAVQVLTHEAGPHLDLTLLHCVSRYPAPLEDMNVGAVAALRLLGFSSGLSDHTLGDRGLAAVMAVALGARVIECHVTLSHEQAAPDAGFSKDTFELPEYVRTIREAEAALGDGGKRLRDGEWTDYLWDETTGKRGTTRLVAEPASV